MTSLSRRTKPAFQLPGLNAAPNSLAMSSRMYSRQNTGDAGAQASLHRYIAANAQDTWGYLMLAVIHGFAGRTDYARRAVIESVRQKADINQVQVRRSKRYRDPERMKRVVAVLKEAGLPASAGDPASKWMGKDPSLTTIWPTS